MQLWNRVKELEGVTLYTTGRNKPFRVVAVTSHECIIRVGSTGIERPVSKQELERAAALGPATSLNTAMIRSGGASEYNPAYVLAILRAI